MKAIKLLLIPSWIVGVAAVFMGVDALDRMIHQPFTRIIGHTVLFGVFLAPLATFVAIVLAFVQTLKKRPGVGKAWTLIALSLACILGAFVVLARGFTS